MQKYLNKRLMLEVGNYWYTGVLIEYDNETITLEGLSRILSLNEDRRCPTDIEYLAPEGVFTRKNINFYYEPKWSL